MGQYPFFLFVFCGVFLPRVLSSSHVNSWIDCETMLPHGGGEPQNSTPPYVVAVSFDKYDPGNEIQVTLEGTSDLGFQGFQLQARELEGDVPVGSFKIIDPNTQALACHNISNSAVSYTDSKVKHKVSAIWIAPSDTKSIQFRATFVQDVDNFWVGVQSKTITPRHSQSANITEKRNRKKASQILLEVACTKKGGTYSSSGGCVQSGSSGSSQTNYAIGQVGVIYPAGSQSRCLPGTGGVYSKHGCANSFSSGSGSDQKPVSYPDSQPFPPVRHTYPSILANSGSGTIIHSQGSFLYKTQIHAQGGQRNNPCDQSSSSYNIVICKLSQSSTSQNSNTNGQQGGLPSVDGIIVCGKDGSSGSTLCQQPSSQSNIILGQSGSSSSGSNRPCGQSSSGCLGSKVIVARDISHALNTSSYIEKNESSTTNSSSADVQGGSFISVSNNTNVQGSSFLGPKQSGGQGGSFISVSNNTNVQGSSFLGPKQSGGQGSSSLGSNQHGKPGSHSSEGSQINSARKQSSPGLLLLLSVLSAFIISSSIVPKWFM